MYKGALSLCFSNSILFPAMEHDKLLLKPSGFSKAEIYHRDLPFRSVGFFKNESTKYHGLRCN